MHIVAVIALLILILIIAPYIPHTARMLLYISIAIYFTSIRPLYGVLAVVSIFLFDRWKVREEIPRDIYQTWSTKDLPPKMKACVEKLQRDNPEFEYHLYDDADCRAFIADEFDPKVVKAYDALIPGAFKADLWRYCILYKRGGVYVDIKFQCEPGFSFKDISSDFIVREYNDKGTGLYEDIVYTGCIASKPLNPIFLTAIDRICENVTKKYYGRGHTDVTGPQMFGACFSKGELSGMTHAYYEENGVGFIRDISSTKVIMSHYPEYRDEQKTAADKPYWKTAWMNRAIYRD